MGLQWLGAAVLASAALWPALSLADDGNYLVTVYQQPGRADLSLHYWATKRPGKHQTVWPELGVGYGLTQAWYSRLFLSYIGPDLLSTGVDTLNWQNDVVLTSAQAPFDLALHSQVVIPRDRSEGRTLEAGPVLQGELGLWRANANLFFARTYGAQALSNTQLKYQWRLLYPVHPGLHAGLLGFGELGDWNHWAPADQQSHRLGPALSGGLKVEGPHELRYDLGWLFGKFGGKSGQMLTLTARYLF